MMMLVRMGNFERQRSLVLDPLFLLVTVVPWLVMIWLLWPAR